jgi:hypothetical protein
MNRARTLHDLFHLHNLSARAFPLWTKHLIEQGYTNSRWMHHTYPNSIAGSDRSLWVATL